MLLTVSTTHQPATDLGYLLHKNPARLQTEDLSFGKARVFYPEATVVGGRPGVQGREGFPQTMPQRGQGRLVATASRKRP